MGIAKQFRVYDYVNHPYDDVRRELVSRGSDVFRDATKVAAARAQSVASELHLSFSGIEMSADISISIISVLELPKTATSGPTTRIQLEWEAAKLPRLFPFMRAEISIYPLTSSETQLELVANYEPPFGLIGTAMDTVIGRRIAEASVHRFIVDVATYLRTTVLAR